jgi:hypothetical protein
MGDGNTDNMASDGKNKTGDDASSQLGDDDDTDNLPIIEDPIPMPPSSSDKPVEGEVFKIIIADKSGDTDLNQFTQVEQRVQDAVDKANVAADMANGMKVRAEVAGRTVGRCVWDKKGDDSAMSEVMKAPQKELVNAVECIYTVKVQHKEASDKLLALSEALKANPNDRVRAAATKAAGVTEKAVSDIARVLANTRQNVLDMADFIVMGRRLIQEKLKHFSRWEVDFRIRERKAEEATEIVKIYVVIVEQLMERNDVNMANAVMKLMREQAMIVGEQLDRERKCGPPDPNNTPMSKNNDVVWEMIRRAAKAMGLDMGANKKVGQ